MRQIILSIRDNRVADALVRRLDELQNAESTEGKPNEAEAQAALEKASRLAAAILAACAHIDAYIARPMLGCQCPAGKKRQGWDKGRKFGWFICPRCGRPSQMVVDHWVQNMISQSRDLLPDLLKGEQ